MQIGTVKGEVDTSSFTFRATEEVKKFDFVSVQSNGQWILAQVEEVTKHPDGRTEAEASIIGYRDKGLTKAPRRVIEPDSIVYRADQDLISDTLGLKDSGLQIGNLETDEGIDIFVNGEDFYKHFAVLAQTGAGKSYTAAVLIEELLEDDYPVVIIDPHGEYGSLSEENPESDDPASYDVVEYSPNTDINTGARRMSFSSMNIEKKELLNVLPDSPTNSQMGVLYNSLKRLQDRDEDYSLDDLMEEVSKEDSSAKWNLLNSMEQLEDMDIFSENPVDLENLVEPGQATVINLKAVEPDASEITMYMLAKKLFDLRKKNMVPPFITVIEEAHNFVPEKGFEQAVSNKILRKIASEGRKFGMGLGVISQRPARIDKNVLSQCNTQFILRITNPNDLKAISKSFEGVTSEVESMIKSLPPGVCFVLGNEYPVMANVRTRRSMHGGETQTGDDYSESVEVDVFVPEKERSELEAEEDRDYEVTYYPLYIVDSEDREVLVDGVEGDVKAEREVADERERKVLEVIMDGGSKAEVMDSTGMNISKVTRIFESLEEKGLMEDGEAVDSVLDVEIDGERVEKDEVIEFEVEPDELEFNGEVRKVYYPYFSSGDKVYDPVKCEEV